MTSTHTGWENDTKCYFLFAKQHIVLYFYAMATRIRDIVASLIQNGFQRTSGGKGSHRRFKHPSGVSATIPGKDGDDAKPYLIKQVRKKIEEAKGKGAWVPLPIV